MNAKTKQILTSNEAIVVYVIIALSALISFVNPAFFGLSTVITLSRSMLVTLIFAIFEMVIPGDRMSCRIRHTAVFHCP